MAEVNPNSETLSTPSSARCHACSSSLPKRNRHNFSVSVSLTESDVLTRIAPPGASVEEKTVMVTPSLDPMERGYRMAVLGQDVGSKLLSSIVVCGVNIFIGPQNVVFPICNKCFEKHEKRGKSFFLVPICLAAGIFIIGLGLGIRSGDMFLWFMNNSTAFATTLFLLPPFATLLWWLVGLTGDEKTIDVSENEAKRILINRIKAEVLNAYTKEQAGKRDQEQKHNKRRLNEQKQKEKSVQKARDEFQQIIKLWKQAASNVHQWQVNHPAEYKELYLSAEERLQGKIDEVGGVPTGEGQFRIIDSSQAVVDKHIKIEAKKIADIEVIKRILLDEHKIVIGAGRWAKIQEALAKGA